IVAVALLIGLGYTGSATAQVHSDQELVIKVRKAIERGVEYLRRKQQNHGGWEVDLDSPKFAGGWTGLALVALLNSGVNRDDPAILKGLRYLRSLKPEWTYVRALQTMAFAEAGYEEDRQRIQENVDWLIKARVVVGGELKGWGYTLNSGI